MTVLRRNYLSNVKVHQSGTACGTHREGHGHLGAGSGYVRVCVNLGSNCGGMRRVHKVGYKCY